MTNQDGVVFFGREFPEGLIRNFDLIKCETGLGSQPRQRNRLCACHTQGRFIIRDLLILKIALDDAGVRFCHLRLTPIRFTLFSGHGAATRNAWSMSALMSSTSSKPTERRT